MKRLAAWNILTGVEYREPVSVSAGILALNYSRVFYKKEAILKTVWIWRPEHFKSELPAG